jgi:16S rRNA (guanine527-N7)-methyltransferase
VEHIFEKIKKEAQEQRILFEKGMELLNLKIDTEKFFLFEEYLKLLLQWNQKINLFSANDTERIAERHLLESIAWVPYFKDAIQSPILDLGTGSGFPGVPLAILFPEKDIVLLDSKKKKTLFLEKVKEKLELNIQIVSERIEKFNQNKEVFNKFHIVISRAVASLSTLAGWVRPILKRHGSLLTFKGANLDSEIDLLKKERNKYPEFEINVIEFNVCKNLQRNPSVEIRKLVKIKFS